MTNSKLWPGFCLYGERWSCLKTVGRKGKWCKFNENSNGDAGLNYKQTITFNRNEFNKQNYCVI